MERSKHERDETKKLEKRVEKERKRLGRSVEGLVDGNQFVLLDKDGGYIIVEPVSQASNDSTASSYQDGSYHDASHHDGPLLLNQPENGSTSEKKKKKKRKHESEGADESQTLEGNAHVTPSKKHKSG